ncbi:MAG: FAD-binding oxidoreductase [Thermaerobacter sp.]|nr:FAD-binding oxidoreductase [Thermaerobacter sp.]
MDSVTGPDPLPVRPEWRDRLLEAAGEAQATGQCLVPTGLGQRGRQAGLRVDLAAFDRMADYQPADLVVTMEAGCTINRLNQILAENQQWIPWDPADGRDDTLGGLVAAGLDSALAGGFGTLRDRVLAMGVWTPGFGFIRAGAPVVKNVAGYNLPRLFFGSRGRFGVIASVTLKVAPRPRSTGIWQFDGPVEETALRVRQGEAMAEPWAMVRTHCEAGRCRTAWVWMGTPATVDRLSGLLGPPAGEWLPTDARLGSGCSAMGGVPRNRVAALLQWWPGPVMAEWQTGWFWGRIEGDREWWQIDAAIRQWGGAVRWVAGGCRPDDESDGALDPVATRLKQQFDPHGILPAVAGRTPR